MWVSEGAVRVETYDDRVCDYSSSWHQLFASLNFTNIEQFEQTYRGHFTVASIFTALQLC